MRTALTIVVITFLVGFAMVAMRDPGARVQAQGKGGAVAREKEMTWDEVKGWGRTEQEAKDYAAGKAQKLIRDYLQILNGPDVGYIKDKLITTSPKRLPAEDQELNKGVKALCWSWE